MKRIVTKFIFALITLSLAVFLIGVFETTRNEFMFQITEDNFMNAEELPQGIFEEYLNFRNSYIFTNDIFITILNFLGLVILFYLMWNSWMIGRKQPPYQLTDVFNTYGMAMILLVYFGIILFNYVFNVFINQLVVLLFNDIYQAIFIYSFFVEYFFYLLLLAYVLSFLSNQIKNFDLIR